LDDEAIVALAGRFLDRHPDFDLEEALHLLHDASNARITDLKRRLRCCRSEEPWSSIVRFRLPRRLKRTPGAREPSARLRGTDTVA
jgi:hypothetical protein